MHMPQIIKPVAIFRHVAHEGPGYLGTFLDEQKIPWQLIKVDEGEVLPAPINAYSGLVFMGGPMSVNDELAWLASSLILIREAYQSDIPLLGHCLGAQLMSKAFGATVSQNAIKEIGWGEVSVTKNSTAQYWFGELEGFNSFHWHGETFNMPENATHILSSPYCKNQAYAIGKHLALQCHIEVTAKMVQSWCEEGAEELASAASSSLDLHKGVQQAHVMQENLPLHCFFLNKVAKQVYTQWIKGLVH